MKVFTVFINLILIFVSCGLLLFSSVPIFFCDRGELCGTAAMILAFGPVLAILVIIYSFSNLADVKKSLTASIVAFILATLPLVGFQLVSFFKNFTL